MNTPTIDEIVALAQMVTPRELIEAINRTLQEWRDRGMDMGITQGLQEWVKKEKDVGEKITVKAAYDARWDTPALNLQYGDQPVVQIFQLGGNEYAVYLLKEKHPVALLGSHELTLLPPVDAVDVGH